MAWLCVGAGLPPTLSGLGRAYREGSLSPLAAVEHCLSAASSSPLGAFSSLLPAQARQAAIEATRALEQGEAVGPFHGIPFAVKDVFDVASLPTAAGSAAFSREPSESAEVVRRLQARGGILIGKLKTEEFAAGAWGINQRMGSPRNPWDARDHRVCGGSSSGSGAAVSGGLVPCALATDTGGSTRLPAAFCGVVGLKTTEGLLPLDGVVPLSHTLDTVGVIALCVEDAAMMLDAMLPTSSPSTSPSYSEAAREGTTRGVAGLRLALAGEAERAAVVDRRQLDAYDAAASLLGEMGARLSQMELEVSALAESNGLICFCEGYYHHRALVEDPSAPLDEIVRARLQKAGRTPVHEYVGAMLQRDAAKQEFLAKLGDCDALLLPTTPMLPPVLSQVDPKTACSGFTRAANYLGLCAISVPTGLTSPISTETCLPTSMQIICRANQEEKAIRIAAAYEAARGPLASAPPLAHPPRSL